LSRLVHVVAQQHLVQREHRKETVRSKRKEQAALLAGGIVAAAAAADEEEEAPAKAQVISYCALDYPRIVDAVRLKLDKLEKGLKVRLHCASVCDWKIMGWMQRSLREMGFL
jgi:hypothetical protein